MSLDLLVFNKTKAPSDPMEFLKWFHKKAEWKADRDYNDIKGTDQPLVDFFMEMIKTYPAMNGPYAPTAARERNGVYRVASMSLTL